MSADDKLTAQQQRFVDEYVVCLNGGKAAKAAGYSEKHGQHYQAASVNLRIPKIYEAIDRALAAKSERIGLKADRVIRELMAIAFSDHRRVMRWGDGGITFFPSEELDDDTAASIAEITERSVETQRGYKVEQRVKMHDKTRALDLLGRHLGVFAADAGKSESPAMQLIAMLASGEITMADIKAIIPEKKP